MDLLSVYDSDSSDDCSATNIEGSIRMMSSVAEASLLFVRSHPHVDGNWVGSCCCRLEESLDDQLVDAAIERVVAMAESGGYKGACLRHSEFHISLSRAFYLQESNIAPFVDALTQRLHGPPGSCAPFPVTIDIDQPALLHNDEATRSFLVWPVYGHVFPALVEQCDTVLARYDQPRFYDPPLFHISLASFVPVLRMELPVVTSENDDVDDDARSGWIRQVFCKFGTTQLFPIPLRKA